MKRMWSRRGRGWKKKAGRIQRGGRSYCPSLCPYEGKAAEILQYHRLHLLQVRVRERESERKQDAMRD